MNNVEGGAKYAEAIDFVRKFAKEKGVEVTDLGKALELLEAEKARIDYVIGLLEGYKNFRDKK
jgi:hypothetical protein